MSAKRRFANIQLSIGGPEMDDGLAGKNDMQPAIAKVLADVCAAAAADIPVKALTKKRFMEQIFLIVVILREKGLANNKIADAVVSAGGNIDANTISRYYGEFSKRFPDSVIDGKRFVRERNDSLLRRQLGIGAGVRDSGRLLEHEPGAGPRRLLTGFCDNKAPAPAPSPIKRNVFERYPRVDEPAEESPADKAEALPDKEPKLVEALARLSSEGPGIIRLSDGDTFSASARNCERLSLGVFDKLRTYDELIEKIYS